MVNLPQPLGRAASAFLGGSFAGPSRIWGARCSEAPQLWFPNHQGQHQEPDNTQQVVGSSSSLSNYILELHSLHRLQGRPLVGRSLGQEQTGSGYKAERCGNSAREAPSETRGPWRGEREAPGDPAWAGGTEGRRAGQVLAPQRTGFVPFLAVLRCCSSGASEVAREPAVAIPGPSGGALGASR